MCEQIYKHKDNSDETLASGIGSYEKNKRTGSHNVKSMDFLKKDNFHKIGHNNNLKKYSVIERSGGELMGMKGEIKGQIQGMAGVTLKKAGCGSVAQMATSVTWDNRYLAGDEVGTAMKAELDPKDIGKGSPPQAGEQSNLMALLETDRGRKGTQKYIRGHLLNEHLGGEGKAYNMFPITAQANKDHEVNVEKAVKTLRYNRRRTHVIYNVKIEGIRGSLGRSKSFNFVTCRMICEYGLKGKGLTTKTIHSRYTPDTKRMRRINKAKETRTRNRKAYEARMKELLRNMRRS